MDQCTHWRRTSTSSNPSTGSQIKINPSAVPTENGWGLEGIYFNDEVDLAVVRGNGRMGAAISPSNSEETFFGPPGFELDSDLLNRKMNKKKYPSQKYTLATAIILAESNGSGFSKYNIKLGVMAKYNKLTKNVTPGGGLSGSVGPISFGYSLYGDQTYIDFGPYSVPPSNYFLFKYRVQTYNFGLFLNSLALDYSNLHLETEDHTSVTTIHLYTANLSLGNFIFTASKRIEDSPFQEYNYETKQLEQKQVKENYFGGIQYNFSPNITVGALYNYYLLREFAATATLFF
ncbi:MAG: hypothetical protein ACXVCY_08385 [Pseudobdellovibrionaceae bacterium]